MDREKIFSYIESMRQEMVSTLAELISYPSWRQEAAEGAPFGRPARECLDRALEICKNMGFKVKNVDGYAGTAAYSDKKPLLGILAHLDVVPAQEGWTKDPYKATVENGLLYGRGAMDDKGPAVSVIYAMKALKDLGINLAQGLELIMGTDEECGSGDLAYFATKEKFPELLFTPDASYPLINIEKGHLNAHFSADLHSEILLDLHGGKTVNAVPSTASATVKLPLEILENAVKSANTGVKFRLTEINGAVKISAEGTSAHASTPEIGDNALTALIKLLSLISLDEPTNAFISGLASAFPYGETDGKNAGVKASDEISGALTLVLSILDLENCALSGKIDIRFPVCESVASVGKKLGDTLEKIGFEVKISGSEPHCVPSDSPFVRSLLDAYEAVTGIKGEPFAIGGGTYVHGMAGGVAFGCEIEGEDNRIHGSDEFIRVDALVENAKIFAQAILNVCGTE